MKFRPVQCATLGTGLMLLAMCLGLTFPKAYPSTIPVYPQAKVVRTQEAKTLEVFSADLKTGDDLAKVDAFYQKELSRAGWEIGRRDIDDATITYLIANLPLKARGSISLAAGENETIIRVTVERKGSWNPKK